MEEGIHQEAMLRDRLEYRLLVTNLDKEFFSSEEFRGIFMDWKRIAEKQSKEQNVDVKTLTIGRLIKELNPGQFWKVIAALFGLLSGVAVAAYWVGNKLGQ